GHKLRGGNEQRPPCVVPLRKLEVVRYADDLVRLRPGNTDHLPDDAGVAPEMPLPESAPEHGDAPVLRLVLRGKPAAVDRLHTEDVQERAGRAPEGDVLRAARGGDASCARPPGTDGAQGRQVLVVRPELRLGDGSLGEE